MLWDLKTEITKRLKGKGPFLFNIALKCDCYGELQSTLKGDLPVIQVCSGNSEPSGSDLCVFYHCERDTFHRLLASKSPPDSMLIMALQVSLSSKLSRKFFHGNLTPTSLILFSKWHWRLKIHLTKGRNTLRLKKPHVHVCKHKTHIRIQNS